MAAHYVMRRPGTVERQGAQRRAAGRAGRGASPTARPATLDRGLRPAWHAAGSDADRLRVVIDQVAQLTDTSAVARHAGLVRPDR